MDINKKKKMLNNMNPSSHAVKLGDMVKELTDLQNNKKFVTVTLTASDISSGVATIDTGIEYTSWYGVCVTASDGTVRAITKIAKPTGPTNKTKIALTATPVNAGDTVNLIVMG